MIPSIANIRKAIYCLNKRLDLLEGGEYSSTVTQLSNKVAALESLLDDDALNPTAAIDKFNEIVAFLNSIDNTETLLELLRDVILQSYQQNYVTVLTYSNLPVTGSIDTIYRVSNYNGSTNQVDSASYSEYTWDGTNYTLLCVKSLIGEVFDISEYHVGLTYLNLSAALGVDGANIPQSLRKGGMSVKFVQSSDNKYVSYRYTSTSTAVADFTNIANWHKENNGSIEETIVNNSIYSSGKVELPLLKLLNHKGLTNGAITNADKRGVISNFIGCMAEKSVHIKLADTSVYMYSLSFYTSNTEDSFISGTDYVITEDMAVPANAAYFRVLLKRIDNTSFNDTLYDVIEEIKVDNTYTECKNEIENNKDKIEILKNSNVDDAICNNGVVELSLLTLLSHKTISGGAIVNADKRGAIQNFISCVPNRKVFVKLKGTSVYSYGLAFYSSNSEDSYIGSTTSWQASDSYVVPANTNYIRISFKRNDETSFNDSLSDVVSEINIEKVYDVINENVDNVDFKAQTPESFLIGKSSVMVSSLIKGNMWFAFETEADVKYTIFNLSRDVYLSATCYQQDKTTETIAVVRPTFDKPIEIVGTSVTKFVKLYTDDANGCKACIIKGCLSEIYENSFLLDYIHKNIFDGTLGNTLPIELPLLTMLTRKTLINGEMVAGGMARATIVDFLPCEEKVYINLVDNEDYNYGISFYSAASENSFISYVAFGDAESLTIPLGAKYFRLNFKKMDGTEITDGILDIVRSIDTRRTFSSLHGIGNVQYYGNKKVDLRISSNSFNCKQRRIIEILYGEGNSNSYAQSLAIYNDKIFNILDSTVVENDVIVYDFNTHAQLATFSLPVDSDSHNNNAQFTNIFYESTDTYPLLIVSRCSYTQANQDLYIIRIIENNGVYSATLIKRIIAKSDEIPPVANMVSFAVDNTTGLLYMWTNKTGTWQEQTAANKGLIYSFRLPDITNAATSYLGSADILNVIEKPYRTWQGGFAFNGNLYCPIQRCNTFNDEVVAQLASRNILEVINANNGDTEAAVPLPIALEPEGCCLYKNKLYINSRKNWDMTAESVCFAIDEYDFDY